MKILLFGKNGQIGWELQRSLAPLGDVIALSQESMSYCGDLTNLEGLVATIREIKPDIIVNAAAYTAVDNAESDSELAQIVNADAPTILANEAKLSGALLIHYSTDYVFNGSGTKPWVETDLVEPVNIYGHSKLAGEQGIQSSGCKYLIFRTSWVYGTRGNNFAKTMLRLAQERDALTVIDDQVGAPTSADLLADVTAHAIRSVALRPELMGLYHLVAAGKTTWHGYARCVVEFANSIGSELKVTSENILPVPTTAYPTPAQRPLNSQLNIEKLQENFNLTIPHWQTGVARMLTEFLER